MFHPVELEGLVAIILTLGIPIVVIIMVYLSKMKKDKIRQLIIENHTDAETAKLLIDEPQKAKKPGTIDVGTLKTACMFLGVGLGAFINWLIGIDAKNVYFWLIIAFGFGVGMLCAFIVELHLAKKQHPTEDNWTD